MIGMSQRSEIIRFLEELQKPVDIARAPDFTPEEIPVIKRYQDLAKELFTDLKADGYISFEDVKEAPEEIERRSKFTKITTDLANKLMKTKEFVAQEQFFILLSLYLWECEVTKNLFREQLIKNINAHLPPKRRVKIGKHVTLGPFVEVMKRYRKGKYVDLFSDINVDLRNAFAHFKFDFPDDEILYFNKSISTLDLIYNYRKITALPVVLYLSREKAFANEYKLMARNAGIIEHI